MSDEPQDRGKPVVNYIKSVSIGRTVCVEVSGESFFESAIHVEDVVRLTAVFPSGNEWRATPTIGVAGMWNLPSTKCSVILLE